MSSYSRNELGWIAATKRDLWWRFKRLAKVLLGLEWYPGLDIRCRTVKYGSTLHGGWDIAVDNLDLDESSVVYSAGVGEEVSFDVALIRRHGVTVHAFDPTPKSVAWVAAQDLPARFKLHEYGLSDTDGDMKFYPPEKPEGVSHTTVNRVSTAARAIRVPMKRLSSIMSELGHERIDLLKMDIEGSEYGVIDDMLDSGISPSILLVEYHHRFPNVGLARTKESVCKLRSAGYRLFSVSVVGEEYCFVRMDR